MRRVMEGVTLMAALMLALGALGRGAARADDGGAVIHAEGSGTVIVLPDNRDEEPLRVGELTPPAGPPGTRVQIAGSGFRQHDLVLFNGRPMPVNEISPHRIEVTIPVGTRTDFVTVKRGDGARAVSRYELRVTWPGPTVTGMGPTPGAPGTLVRLTGANFLPEDGVFYGSLPVPIEARGDGLLDVIVPPHARGNKAFLVRGPRGDSLSPVFTLVWNANIASFTPVAGPPGSRVEILGNGFRPGDAVFMGGRPMQVLEIDERRIMVVVPLDAPTDVFSVLREGQVLSSSGARFEVLRPPSLVGFAPAAGPPGTHVTLTGANIFGDARVFYGAEEVPILARGGSNTITVAVPRNAGASQPFVLQTRSGDVRTGQVFRLLAQTIVDVVAPLRGGWGTRVRIHGVFNGSEVFYLAALRLPILERGPDEVIVEIPRDAWSGEVAYDDNGQHIVTPIHFEVERPASIAGFAPDAGPPSSQVTITGELLDGTAAVYFGDLPCAILARGPTQLVVALPPNARGMDYLWIDGPGGRVRSADRFRVFNHAHGVVIQIP